MIKSQTRENRRSDAVNLAAAHYNLGIVHQLLGELEVASYHFAQANAHQPKDKYAQKWADTQIMMGVYNPVDSLTGLTITKAGTSQAPKQSMVRNKVEPANQYGRIGPDSDRNRNAGTETSGTSTAY